MSQNGQTHFKNLAVCAPRFLVCLTILGYFLFKGKKTCFSKDCYNYHGFLKVISEWLCLDQPESFLVALSTP